MNKDASSSRLERDDIVRHTLATAEKVVLFYEERLDTLLDLNDFLERENARLQSLLNTYLDKLLPGRPSGGTFGGLPV